MVNLATLSNQPIAIVFRRYFACHNRKISLFAFSRKVATVEPESPVLAVFAGYDRCCDRFATARILLEPDAITILISTRSLTIAQDGDALGRAVLCVGEHVPRLPNSSNAPSIFVRMLTATDWLSSHDVSFKAMPGLGRCLEVVMTLKR
jgi:hypothetical protein